MFLERSGNIWTYSVYVIRSAFLTAISGAESAAAISGYEVIEMSGLLEELSKLFVWEKGFPIPGLPESEWRQDAFGNRMRFSDHGDRNSAFGWEIDHIHPTALGGTGDLGNLRPLHYKANAGLGGLFGLFPPSSR
jgi:hypothetical protein